MKHNTCLTQKLFNTIVINPLKIILHLKDLHENEKPGLYWEEEKKKEESYLTN